MIPANTSSEFQEGTQEGSFSYADIISMVYEHLWLILAIFAVSASLGYYALRTTPVLYSSKGLLMAELDSVRILTEIKSLESEERVASHEVLNTIAATVTRSEVLQLVAAKIKDQPMIKQWSTNAISTNEIARILAAKCNASVRRQSRFIEVSAIDADPELARFVAQEVMEQFMIYEMKRRQGAGRGATNFLSEEAEILKKQVAETDNQLAAFLRTNSISVKESDDSVSAELRDLNNRLFEIRANRMAIEADWENIKKLASEPEKLLTFPSVVQLPNVASIRQQLLDKESENAQLELRYREKHPKMIEARRAFQSLQNALHAEVANAPKGVEIGLKKLQLAEQQLASQIKTQEVKLAEVEALRMIYSRLKTSADHNRELYESVLKRSGELRISMNDMGRADAKHKVSIFEDAVAPRVPFQPNAKKTIGIALMAGFGLSFGLVYLLQMMDQTLKSIDQAEQVFGVPVLGAIPKSAETSGHDDRLVISKNPDSHAAEGFRTLRAAVGLLGREEERKVTLFTSAVPAEGKTFCSSNYALSIAQSGRRTVLVDFDLRRPSVGKTFDIPATQEGVSDCLLGKVRYDQVMVPTENPHLFIISAGTLVPNPSELIASAHTREFLEELRNAFDHVVVDNAPVTAVSDTLMIVRMVDTVCLVTKAAKTPLRVIGRSIELIRRTGVHPSGLILNFISKNKGAGYKYYYYSDKNYAGGYGQEKRKEARG